MALAVMTLGVAAPSAQAVATKAIWGPVTLPAAAGGGSAFPTYQQLGVDVFQIQLSWRETTPQDDPAKPSGNLADPAHAAYSWPSRIDAAITAAQARGMQVAVLVQGTPRWARAGDDAVNKVPDNVYQFRDFLRAASRRYPAVTRWMIWGETNRVAAWNSGPAAYSNLLDAAYLGVKLEGLADVVTGGMTFTFGDIYTPKTWIDGMRCGGAGVKLTCPSGARPKFDEYGHNAFTRRCPDLANGPNHLRVGSRDISDVDTLKSETTAAFASRTEFDDRIWISEFTVSSDRPNRAQEFYVSRATQADWLKRAFNIAGTAPYVSGIGWFTLHDESTAVPNGLTQGLMEYDGDRKPVFAAYQLAPTPPTGTCPRPTPAAPAGPAVDRREPRVGLVVKKRIKLKALLKKGLPFKVRCDEPCVVSASLLVDRRTASRVGLKRRPRRAVKIGKRSRKRLGQNRTTRMRIKLTKKAKRKLRRARGGKLNLLVSVKDTAGNITKVSRKLRLRR